MTVTPIPGDLRFGGHSIDRRFDTNRPGVDFKTNWDEWLHLQRGLKPETQGYFNACPILFENTKGKAQFSPGFPNGDTASSRGNVATFGGPHLRSQSMAVWRA